MTILQQWNVIFVIGFVVYVVTRGIFAARTKSNEIMDRRVGLQEKALFLFVICTSLLFPVLYLFTPLFSFADYELSVWVHWLGFVFMIVGLVIFWRSHTDLGLNWSATLETRRGHKIITHGVYRRIRHPMYLGIWLFSISQALLLNNWLAGWGIVLAFALMYFLRAPNEEQMMIDHFGSSYEEYMVKTGRLFPRVWRKTD